MQIGVIQEAFLNVVLLCVFSTPSCGDILGFFKEEMMIGIPLPLQSRLAFVALYVELPGDRALYKRV